MGIEFRLTSIDHAKLEDLLSRSPQGVSGIVVDPKVPEWQRSAAEAAHDAGAEVFFDPSTARMTVPGFSAPTLTYSLAGPLRVEQLRTRPELHAGLVNQVVKAHPTYVSAVTPPYFLTETMDDHRLNLDLARSTGTRTDTALRPVVLLGTRISLETTKAIAQDYRDLGVQAIELRLPPLGSENESLRKIASATKRAQSFRDTGLSVTLGYSGNIGQVLYALGVVDHFSVGVAQFERIDHARTLLSQQRPLADEFRRSTRVYLPGLALTVSSKVAERLLERPELRSRIGCRAVGCCRDSFRGPLHDKRKHYLQSKTTEVARLQAAPAAWRAGYERERLSRAAALRTEINRFFLDDAVTTLQTRTLESLIDYIDVRAGEVAEAS